jgi:hypothetical protein
MEQQHERIATALERGQALLPQSVATPDEPTREQLA